MSLTARLFIAVSSPFALRGRLQLRRPFVRNRGGDHMPDAKIASMISHGRVKVMGPYLRRSVGGSHRVRTARGIRRRSVAIRRRQPHATYIIRGPVGHRYVRRRGRSRNSPGRMASRECRGRGAGWSRGGRWTRVVEHVLGEVGPGGVRAGEDGTEGIQELCVCRRRRHRELNIFILFLASLVGFEVGGVGAFSELGRESHGFSSGQWMERWSFRSHGEDQLGLYIQKSGSSNSLKIDKIKRGLISGLEFLQLVVQLGICSNDGG